MKRPVTLLCLSDLHLVDQTIGNLAITQLKTSLNKLVEANCRLRPDYIVMAGDLIDATETEKSEDRRYLAVKKWIELLRTDLNLPKFNVIVVPGNHDKILKRDEKTVDKRKCKALLKSMASCTTMKWEDVMSFDSNFLSFGKFYQYYLKKDNELCLFAPSLKPPKTGKKRQPSVETTSGIKVFLDDKICFLSINTEWFYLRGADKSLPVQLCTPLVYNSLKRIQLEYPDFTIITIMHRNPTRLSWNEINGNSNNMPDILRYLYTYSDIIISGHEHTERLLPPHRMINRAQLFQLGSVSVESRQNTIPAYNAALLYLDPIRRTVESYDLKFDCFTGKWTINDPGLFALSDKYTLNTVLIQEDSFAKAFPKSLEKSEIQKAIIASFPGLQNSNFAITCIDVKISGYLDRIRTAMSQSDRVFVALYIINAVDIPLLQEGILEVRRVFHQELLSQKIILNGVQLAVPLIVNESL